MENKNTIVLKQTMTYSAIIGVILVIIMALQSFTMVSKIPGFNFIYFIILFTGIVFFMRKFSIDFPEEYLSFGKLVGIGFQIFLFASVWVFLYQVIETKISTDPINSFINLSISQIEISTSSDLQKAATVEYINLYPVFWYTINLFFSNLIMSTPIILFCGYYFKKGTKPTQTN